MLSIVKQVRTLICISAIYFSTNLLAQNTVGPFTYTPGPASGTLMGIATIDGSPAADGDVIAAFDATGNCAGANTLIMSGDAYIQLPIYGDDTTIRRYSLERAVEEFVWQKEIMKEIVKCGKDPKYFFNSYLKIQHPVI